MERTNADRAEVGRVLVEFWRRTVNGGVEDEADPRDAIADILHALHADGRNWEVEVRLAVDNATAEIDPDYCDCCTIVCILPDRHAGPCQSRDE